MYVTTETLLHGEQLYSNLLGRIRRDRDLVAAMWADAESRPNELDVPGTHWSVALVEDGWPAAWCAARIQDDGVIKCHSNYEVRQWRGLGLYEEAYHERHRAVILAYQRPAITYLFAGPIALHEASGWRPTGVAGDGAVGDHRWQELRRAPARPACR